MSNQFKSTSNQAGYDRWASFYDQYPNPTVAADELHFPNIWQHLTGKNILEVGCGTGRHTYKLASQENHVTGIDISPEMLRQAERKIQGKPVVLLEGDFLAYEGFQDSSFDAVVISLVIEHIEKLDPFFLKIRKVLKPLGRVYISEIHPDRTANGILAHFKDPSDGHDIHLQGYAHTKLDFSEAIERVGLSLVEVKDVLGSDELATLNPKWHKHIGCPMIQIWVLEKR